MVGYKHSQVYHTLFVRHIQKGAAVVIVYVDNIIVTRDDQIEKHKLKSHLRSKFEVKDLRVLRYFLRIEVAHLRKGNFISQKKNISLIY